FLVAWATEPAAPLAIGTGGARENHLTLMIFRAAPPSSSRLAAREAVLSRVGFEPMAPIQGRAVRGAMTGGGTAFYEGQLPDAKTWALQVRGVGAAPAVMPRGFPSLWMKFEAWNTARNRWEVLAGTLRRDGSPQSGWNFSARVPSDFARQPDRMLKVRIILANGQVRVSSVRVSGE
ncbi:MAG: hypothetical protein KY445_05460, partial [Armatimonadetes bacterium]|nr:hypothetical protein [Armatimonadota bacterium]